MTIEDAKAYLREHWPTIRSQLLSGTYQPQPVKRVETPTPDGGVRKLGVPWKSRKSVETIACCENGKAWRRQCYGIAG